jgi:hypothetical protein
MIQTGIRRIPDTSAVGNRDGESAAGSNLSRLAVHLWTLLHAQALLRGTIGAPGGAPCIEDDRPRLAARRQC